MAEKAELPMAAKSDGLFRRGDWPVGADSRTR